MFGFLFGAACLVGVALLVRHGRHHHHPGHYRRHFGMRSALYAIFARLDATPAQEKAILAAAEELEGTLKNARGTLRKTREAAAKAVGGDRFDEAPLAEAFTAQDTAFAEIRSAVQVAGRKIHEVLDERQRKTFAEIVESPPGWFGHSHGRFYGRAC